MKIIYFIIRNFNKLTNHPCKECGEVPVPFYKHHCDFCDFGEGKVK
jgi:ribosomal protein L37E